MTPLKVEDFHRRSIGCQFIRNDRFRVNAGVPHEHRDTCAVLGLIKEHTRRPVGRRNQSAAQQPEAGTTEVRRPYRTTNATGHPLIQRSKVRRRNLDRSLKIRGIDGITGGRLLGQGVDAPAWRRAVPAMQGPARRSAQRKQQHLSRGCAWPFSSPRSPPDGQIADVQTRRGQLVLDLRQGGAQVVVLPAPD